MTSLTSATDADSAVDAAFQRFADEIASRPKWLRGHTARVVADAKRLARLHNLDVPRCAAAAMGHDLFRHWQPDDLLDASRRRGIPIDPVEAAAPITLHGPLAAEYALDQLDVHDPDILAAIRFHTTAHPDYSLEALAVFVADKIEPKKLARDPGLQAVASAAERDLRAAASLFLERRLTRQLHSGEMLHPLAVASRNHWLANSA